MLPGEQGPDDPGTEGAKDVPLMRLKRWDFTAEETITAWQSSDLGDGLHLELPLEMLKLPQTPLVLWVRLVTSDGRKLLTQLPFEASQLGDPSTDSPRPLPNGLARAETEAENSAAPVNVLRIETERISQYEKLKLAANQQLANQPSANQPSGRQEPTADQPRWRASMQRTDRTAVGFATTSGKTSGWITQSPGRQPYGRTRVASTRRLSHPVPAPSGWPDQKPGN